MSKWEILDQLDDFCDSVEQTAFDDGYNIGYQEGKADYKFDEETTYDNGYNDGYEDGYAERSAELEDAVGNYISETETTSSELKTAIEQITGIIL